MSEAIIPQSIEMTGHVEGRSNWTSTVAGKMIVGATLFAEITPLNEALRGAAAVAAYHVGGPEAAVAALAASTLLVEGAAGVVTADALDTPGGQAMTGRVNEKLGKVGDKLQTNLVTDLAASTIVGTAVGTAVRHRQDPTRTRGANRKFAWGAASLSSVLVGAEGHLVAEGIQHPSPETLGLAALAIGATVVGARAIHRRMQAEVTEPTAAEQLNSEDNHNVAPRYNLSKEELATLEGEMVEIARRRNKNGVVGMFIDSRSRYANVLRTYEAQYFPEVADAGDEIDENTTFLALVDTRKGIDRVVHGTTITHYDEKDDEKTGMYTIDSLIERGNFTKQEFETRYRDQGIDLNKTLAVETNFRIGKREKNYRGMRASDTVYLLVLDMLRQKDPLSKESAVFGTVNDKSLHSFDRAGLKYDLLLDRDDFVTEESEVGKESLPVALLAKGNRKFFVPALYGARITGALPKVIEV